MMIEKRCDVCMECYCVQFDRGIVMYGGWSEDSVIEICPDCCHALGLKSIEASEAGKKEDVLDLLRHYRDCRIDDPLEEEPIVGKGRGRKGLERRKKKGWKGWKAKRRKRWRIKCDRVSRQDDWYWYLSRVGEKKYPCVEGGPYYKSKSKAKRAARKHANRHNYEIVER